MIFYGPSLLLPTPKKAAFQEISEFGFIRQDLLTKSFPVTDFSVLESVLGFPKKRQQKIWKFGIISRLSTRGIFPYGTPVRTFLVLCTRYICFSRAAPVAWFLMRNTCQNFPRFSMVPCLFPSRSLPIDMISRALIYLNEYPLLCNGYLSLELATRCMLSRALFWLYVFPRFEKLRLPVSPPPGTCCLLLYFLLSVQSVSLLSNSPSKNVVSVNSRRTL